MKVLIASLLLSVLFFCANAEGLRRNFPKNRNADTEDLSRPRTKDEGVPHFQEFSRIPRQNLENSENTRPDLPNRKGFNNDGTLNSSENIHESSSEIRGTGGRPTFSSRTGLADDGSRNGRRPHRIMERDSSNRRAINNEEKRRTGDRVSSRTGLNGDEPGDNRRPRQNVRYHDTDELQNDSRRRSSREFSRRGRPTFGERSSQRIRSNHNMSPPSKAENFRGNAQSERIENPRRRENVEFLKRPNTENRFSPKSRTNTRSESRFFENKRSFDHDNQFKMKEEKLPFRFNSLERNGRHRPEYEFRQQSEAAGRLSEIHSENAESFGRRPIQEKNPRSAESKQTRDGRFTRAGHPENRNDRRRI